MGNFLYHLFVPHHGNNHRAQLLHNSSIFFLLIALLYFNLVVSLVKHKHPGILGISYSLSEDQLLSLTNKARQENGLSPLELNDKLRSAAQLKAQDMIARNYWAHFAPDGTTPWDFIKNAGYNYTYAGENLAKGFTTTQDVISAWMNSSSHRENILSNKYSDIGFSVVEGKLLGEDTVLIVEEYGSQESSAIATSNTPLPQLAGAPVAQQAMRQPVNVASAVRTPNEIHTTPLIDSLKTSKGLLVTLFSILLFSLFVDLVIVDRKKIPRFVGHNLDHIMIIFLFILTVLLQRTGHIF